MGKRPPTEALRGKPHRQDVDYPPLAPGAQPLRLGPWTYALNRTQMGRLANGGCVYGGQVATLWSPLRDMLQLTNGPVGCGVYAQANRPAPDGPSGVATFSELNLSTDFQEKDVVFGGVRKLAQAITEASQLFPLHRGLSLLSTCPIALIGDDIDGVAKAQSAALGLPVVPVHCAGFRRGDGIGATHATIFGTWRQWAERPGESEQGQITLLCREMGGAWHGIIRLLEQTGLHVVARWPGGGNRSQTGRLGQGQLVVSVGMDYWAKRLNQQFGCPWIAADFLGPSATCTSLRAIAAHFGPAIGQRVEALISAQAGEAAAQVAAVRARIAGQLYFSFAPLQPGEIRAFTDFGLRVGSALQGWPDRHGRWQMPASLRRVHEMTPDQVTALLHQAQPDVIDGVGNDGAALQKQGYAIIDARCQAELERAATGFAGTAALAREFQQLFDSPLRALHRPPWSTR